MHSEWDEIEHSSLSTAWCRHPGDWNEIRPFIIADSMVPSPRKSLMSLPEIKLNLWTIQHLIFF